MLPTTTNNTCMRCSTWSQANCATSMWRRCSFTPMQLEITGELLKVSQQMENQGEYHIRSISAIKWAASGDEFIVKVAWEGLEEAESTREPVSRVP